MSEPDFDVIVVGAGIAGCVSAYLLARRGLSVALIERGETPGSKNLSGGVLYCAAMEQVFPDFLERAPIERRVDRNRIVFMNPQSWVGIDYADERLYDNGRAVTVLRAHLDPWLAEQAEQAGALVMSGVRVDSLLREGSQVVGIVAGDDHLRSRVVIAADGVNSFIARDAGLRPRPSAHDQALGVKALIRLSKAQIEDRFGVTGDHGVACAMVGDCTQSVAGGGFLYSNRDTVSVGLVVRLDDLVAKGVSSDDLVAHLMAHPFVDSFVNGGEVIEYGAHLVNEGGRSMMGSIVHDGLILIGDAAGLTLNTGLTLRGMDLAVGSAQAADQAIADALAKDDTSRTGLHGYEVGLAQSFVGRDMDDTYAKAPQFFDNDRLYGSYGQLAADVLHASFDLDATPRKHLMATAMAALKKSPLKATGLIRDGIKAVRSL